MSELNFDINAARQNLKRIECEKKAKQEAIRIELLEATKSILVETLKDKGLEVWLIGSIIQQNSFRPSSDIDIVVKNLVGDRFDLWILLESKLKREVEVIKFEECDFQEEILNTGLRVI